MTHRTRILIVGIGGVGGYFGGLLAKAYASHKSIEIIFIARGAHLQAIRQHGLRVQKGADSFIAHPHLATDNFSEALKADYIILATKSYDLKDTAAQLSVCVTDNTVFLPLLNGVDSTPFLKTLFPQNEVLYGCAYIVSQITSPGVIENQGNIQKIFFGTEKEKDDDSMRTLETIFREAGVEATLAKDIQSIVWTKYIFISTIGTATSFYGLSMGQVGEQHAAEIQKLIHEITDIAHARKIPIDAHIEDQIMDRLKKIPYSNTTSMQRDFESGKRHTELQSLTAYVIQEGKKYGVPTPEYERMFAELKQRNQ